MRKNLPINRRNPFFLYACLFRGIGIIWQTKLLKYIAVTDRNKLMLLSLST
ncbi:hypothetical protein [Pedobacter kyonggii]|uniref:hypothetical protein n=1 Tax=Pedobacter kyonggii TaxID=1926871 RepID=UPI0013EEEB8D|nr:hypothetical protein [Pedobacter kyonggii]